jgi:hypothetical protein
LVIVYQKDGTIAAYRNGLAYGESYRTNAPPKFEAKKARVLFGLRHGEKARPGAMLAGRIDQAQLYNRALTPEQIGAAAEQPWLSENEILARLTPAQRVLRTNWSNEIAKLSAEVKEMTSRTAYVVTPKKAPVTHLLVRGSPFQPGDSVAAGGVESVQGLPATFDLAPDAPGGERRKKLAEWIAHQDNPLLARVMVNRLWHYHFGQGLVKTPNDLGYSGGLPSHPDLLEWLAAEFRDGGWNLKAMHKVMVTSATYRQSSLDNPKARRSDASNVWLWRHTPVRLEAEVLRDAILKVSGQLNVAAGGPGFRDFRMHRHKGAMVYDVADPEGPEFNRRTIFRMWARGSQHPLLTTFDSPDPSATTPVRGVTSTPLGALSLMNASFVLRHSDGFAKRLQADAGDEVDQQIHRAYQLAFGRAAKPEELQLTSEFVKRNGLPAFCRVVFNATEFLYVN